MRFQRANKPVYALAGAALIVPVIVSVILWMEPHDVVAHVTAVTDAIAPMLTFVTVLVAATGWVVTARLNGQEARRTEREKRAVADAAHRDLVRARFERIWGIIDEALGAKPYQPAIVERFIAETEDVYWKVETFQAFSSKEHPAIRDALDRTRLDNALTMEATTDTALQQSGSSRRDVIREYFMTSLDALERVFRDVFDDLKFVRAIERRRDADAAEARRIREPRAKTN